MNVIFSSRISMYSMYASMYVQLAVIVKTVLQCFEKTKTKANLTMFSGE